MKLFNLYSLLGIILISFISCDKESDDTPPEPKPVPQEKIEIDEISGYIQKGPYVNGTGISMYELNESLAQTGKSFNTQISGNDGRFEISNISLSSQFVEFSANGFYYDEVKGEISSSQLNLFAISDIKSVSGVNVNLLTHLEKKRVEYLIEEGKSFAEAKKTAQAEILSIFNIKEDDIQSSELLDISKDAILLGISSILQGDRSVGDLTELLASISSDIEEDGVLNNSNIQDALRQSALNLDAPVIRTNLIERYKSLGKDVNIPDFQQYIDGFLNFTATKPKITGMEVTVISADSIRVISRLIANNAETEVVFEYGETESLGADVVFNEGPVNGGNEVALGESVSGLKPATIYYYRLSASNEFGSVSSSINSFTTLGGLPEEVGHLTLESGNKTIKVQGAVNPNFLETKVYIQYIEYLESFDQADSVLADQSPLSPYSDRAISALIENLNPGTRYWARLKMENEVGVTYGDPIDISTLGSEPKILIFAIDNSKIGAKSAEAYIEIGENTLATRLILEYSTSNTFDASVEYLDTIVGPSEKDIYLRKKIESLEMDQAYFARLTLKNELGEDSFVDEFKTLDGVIQLSDLMYDGTYADPEVHFDIDITKEGGLPIIERGLLYGASSGLTIDSSNSNKAVDPVIAGTIYTYYLTDLEMKQTYYARSYAINESGVYYSNEVKFTSPGLPTAYIHSVYDVTSNSATVYGYSPDSGGSQILSEGFCWGTEPNTNIEDSFIIDETEASEGNAFLNNLEPGTTYYVRYFAKNRLGIDYSTELSFTTKEN
ncbi:fibronectin type III domain-containing protein [Salegentibacter chungangensis]|uniref:Fibronectin type-III domain-containing protein n=1 Tax=Salegentibacter chungangensis TaxID=1335724 RepID=A0ABW3NNY6_9FLAO